MRRGQAVKRWPAWVLLVFVVVGFLAVGATGSTGRARRGSGPRRSSSASPARCARARACSSRATRRRRTSATRSASSSTRASSSDDEIIAVIESSFGGRILLVPAGVGLRRAGVGAAGGRADLRPGRAGVHVPPLAPRGRRRRRPDRRRPRARRRRAGQRGRGPGRRARSVTTVTSHEPGPPGRAGGRAAVPAAVAARPRRRAGRRRRRRGRLRDAARRLHEAGRRRAARHRGGQGRAAPAGRPALDPRASSPSPSWSLVAATAGWLVARSSGQRLGDETITGGAPSDDVAVLLARARTLLGDRPARRPGAVRAGARRATRAAGGADVLRVAAVRGLERAPAPTCGRPAVSTAQQQLARAVAADATYPDPHCFLAVIAGNADADIPTARTEIDQCLALDPPAEIRGLVEQFAASLDATTTLPATTVPG